MRTGEDAKQPLQRKGTAVVCWRPCDEAAVGQLRNSHRGSAWLSAATLLLVVSGLAWSADPMTSPGVEATADATPRLDQEKSVPDLLPISPPPSNGDFWTRQQLIGDSTGARNNLAEHGLTFFGDITQYDQGVTAGGLAQQFEYGDRGDYLIDVDSRKMGLWEGGHLDFRGETRLGQDCNLIDGALAPSNFALALPQSDQNVTALTGVQFTQDLSDSLSVFAGKLNLLDGTPTTYARGMRLNYFWNAAMQNNLSRVFLIPSALGTGFTFRDEAEPVFNFYLLNTDYSPTTSGFSTRFANGVVVYGEYRLRTNWFHLPGHSTFGFLYSSATRTALDSNPYVLLQAVRLGATPVKNSTWTATYRIDQVVHADPDNPKRNVTLNSDLGLTDGNPNPIGWFANLSLVAGSPISGRDDDTVGIGYYHLGISNLPVLTLHGFGAEDGFEMFYNAAVTPWLHVTPDLQVLDPAQHNNATALLIGVRGRLSF